MKKLIVSCCIMVASLTAQAQTEWELITKTEESNPVLGLKKYIKNVGDNVYRTLVYSKNANFVIYLIDCSSKEYALAKVIERGNITNEYKFNDQSFALPPVGSVGERIVEWTCK